MSKKHNVIAQLAKMGAYRRVHHSNIPQTIIPIGGGVPPIIIAEISPPKKSRTAKAHKNPRKTRVVRLPTTTISIKQTGNRKTKSHKGPIEAKLPPILIEYPQPPRIDRSRIRPARKIRAPYGFKIDKHGYNKRRKRPETIIKNGVPFFILPEKSAPKSSVTRHRSLKALYESGHRKKGKGHIVRSKKGSYYVSYSKK